MPTLAVKVPSAPVTVPLGVAMAPLLTLMVTETPATALRLPSMAVAVATTVSLPLLEIVGALSTRTMSAAVAPPPVPPPKGGVPASLPPPPPPHAASTSKTTIETTRPRIIMFISLQTPASARG